MWPREAVELLISLYEEFEAQLEDPKTRKKDIWYKIARRLHAANYDYSQNKVESKWRSLLKSHKDIRDNRKKTGSRRKIFQFYKRIEPIVAKRHDINPPFVAGSAMKPNMFKLYNAKPSTSRVATEWGDSKRVDVNVERCGANMERGDVNVEQGGAIVEHGGANVERGGANVERGGANVERGGANVERGGANVERGGANVERGGANVQRGGANVERGDVNVGRGDVNNKRGESPSSLVLLCSKSAKSRRLT